MSSHDSKRILIHNYYTPKLPANTGIPSLTSNRIAGDYSIQPSQPTTTSSFPQVPDDIQAKLLHVGMRVRKHVADGHRVEGGSIPSYQPNFYSTVQQQSQPQPAGRNISAPAAMTSLTTFGVSGSKTRIEPSRNLKRGLEDDGLTEEEDTDEDDEMEPSSFQEPILARRLASAGTVAKAKVFYVPSNRQHRPNPSSNDDFEDATFLASRESLN